MMPIGLLMIEHRLIERMIALVDEEQRRLEAGGQPDFAFIDTAVDFIRTYADRCHHGKEEDILFRDLAGKPLAPEHKATMAALVEEHVYARGVVKNLLAARQRAAEGDPEAARRAAACLRELAAFYPGHIEREDQHFFLPSMDYFSAEEQQRMLDEMYRFDREMIHAKYRQVVETLEQEPPSPPAA